MLNINDPVRVKFLGEIVSGKIVSIGGHSKIIYQILLDNPQKTFGYWGEDEILTQMTHTTLKRSVAIETINSLKESIKDWRAYQSAHELEGNQPINDIIANYETVIAALEGDTITIED